MKPAFSRPQYEPDLTRGDRRARGVYYTPLEIAESVDMNRVLEHGYKVRMVPTQYHVYSVDTEHDRQRVEELMATDDLLPQYR